MTNDKILDTIVAKKSELKAQGRLIEEIFCSETMVLNNWIFIVEKWGKLFLLMNSKNLIKILGSTPVDKAVFIRPDLFDIPISIEDERMRLLTHGKFIWAKEANTDTEFKEAGSEWSAE